MKSSFEQALAGLNPQQLAAVKTIDGPVLVIAGPGTGKTELLSSRVANILHQTDTAPNNILCLTFTNKAAVNMKARIIEKIGAGGTKVVASTFHSFAGEIMNLYPDYFWNAARLKIAPDSVQLDIIESIVASLPLDNPLALRFAGQFTLLGQIKEAIKLTKEAGLTPEKLRAIIKANLAYIDLIEPHLVEIFAPRLSVKGLATFSAKIQALPTQPIDKTVYPLISLSTVLNEGLRAVMTKDEGSGKCSYTSRWKGKWVQNVDGKKGLFTQRERNDWWLKLADVYEVYREQLHQRGFYDYADMLIEVVGQLEQHPEVLADIQERFSYVLIDEFQDTTLAQMRLSHLVADHYSAEGKPNLMAVGDDDQSIFKFSGAELNNMLGFKRAYPSAKIIVLTDNYRSSQAVLDVAKAIITQADWRVVDTDVNLSKDLVAKKPPKRKGQIRGLAYPSSELQLSDIARDIQKKYSPERDIAVLARAHDSLKQVAAILQKLNVPVRYEQSSNSLEHPIISQIYLTAKLLVTISEGDKEQADGLIHQIIRWPTWGFKADVLWQLAKEARGRSWLDTIARSKDKQLRRTGQWFLWLASQAAAQPLAITIEQILGLRPSEDFTSPIREHFVRSAQADTNAYFHGLSAIQLLRSLVHEFAVESEPTLEEFVRFVEVNRQNGVVIADESPFITGRHAVQLLTVHKAKGLEFDDVYIIDAVESEWQPSGGGRKPPANLPLQPPLDDFDDYVRLMYVAATRAKSSLTISGYYQDHAGKDVAISSIVQAAIPIKRLEEENQSRLIEVLEENLRWPSLSGGAEAEMLKAQLETYNLYATHLLDFMDVSRGGPQRFKERHLLHLPEVKTASLSYGSAMHAALETAQMLVNKGGLKLPVIYKSFEAALKEEQLPPAQHQRWLVKGQQTLQHLFKGLNYRLPSGSLSEQRIKDVLIGAARIGGKLDRVDRLSAGRVVVVDYKTGSLLSSFDTKDKNQAIRAYKHKLQLVFYALLLSEQQDLAAGKIEGQMVYVQSDNPQGLIKPYTPTPEDLDRLRALIQAVWQKIIKLELPDISSYSRDIDGIRQFEADLIKNGRLKT